VRFDYSDDPREPAALIYLLASVATIIVLIRIFVW